MIQYFEDKVLGTEYVITYYCLRLRLGWSIDNLLFNYYFNASLARFVGILIFSS